MVIPYLGINQLRRRGVERSEQNYHRCISLSGTCVMLWTVLVVILILPASLSSAMLELTTTVQKGQNLGIGKYALIKHFLRL